MESDNSTDIDLNQRPEQNALDDWLDEIEDYRGRIEDRIRQLEEVTFRARERYSLRNSRALSEPEPEPEPSTNSEANPSEERVDVRDSNGTGSSSVTRNVADANRKHCLGAHLLAKALALNPPVEEKLPIEEEGGYFDCNICLAVAKDPILTCCGHLFCWPCFYQLPFVNSNLTVRECPVCKGEVSDQGIVPIYGNGNGDDLIKMKSVESGFKIPPRPPAQRIESVRQQRVRRGLRNLSTEERIRHMMSRVRATIQVVTESVTLSSAVTDDIDHQNSGLTGLPSGELRRIQSTLSVGSDSSERFGDNMGSDRIEQGVVIGAPSLSEVVDADGHTMPSNAADEQPELQYLDIAAANSFLTPPAGGNGTSSTILAEQDTQINDMVIAYTDPRTPYLLPASRRRTSYREMAAIARRRRRRLAE